MAFVNRSGSDSRCCQPEGAPYSWIHVEDRSHAHWLEYEAWLDNLTLTARVIEEGEIDELFEAAALGILEDTGDNFTPIKPVTHVPEIFELRRRSGATSPYTYLRFYHCEPSVRPNALIALHRQIKTSEDEQTVALAHAITQHQLGESIAWTP